MTSVGFAESIVEYATLQWFEELGYTVIYGPDISPDGPHPERMTWQEVVLRDRLHDAIARTIPNASPEAIEDAIRQVTDDLPRSASV